MTRQNSTFRGLRGRPLAGNRECFRVKMPERPGVPAFQLRGMATAPETRGPAWVAPLFKACMAYAQEKRAGLIWCNARKTAVGFYQRLGFTILGEEFEFHDVGPHFRMFLPLRELGNGLTSGAGDQQATTS